MSRYRFAVYRAVYAEIEVDAESYDEALMKARDQKDSIPRSAWENNIDTNEIEVLPENLNAKPPRRRGSS